MRRWNGCAGTLVFGAVAAASLLVFEPLLAPFLGVRGALRVFTVGCAALYLLGLGTTWRRGFVAAGSAGGAGLVILALPFSLPATAMLAAGLVALGRSTILHRSRPLRGLALEGLLGVGGLGLAGFLAGGGGITSLALAVWGYFLVQSAFFVVGGVGLRRPSRAGDPFERATGELRAWLETSSG